MSVKWDSDPLVRWMDQPTDDRNRPDQASDLETAHQQLARQLIERRDRILQAVHLATERFLRTHPSEKNIGPLLEALGTAAEVSRVYIFENSSDSNGTILTSQRNEWVHDGIDSQISNDELQQMPLHEAGFERWARELSSGNVVYGHIDQMPQSEQAVLLEQEIQSILVAPIFVGQRWWGFIGFDECSRRREWSPIEIEAIQTAANIIGAALQHQRVAEALLASEQKYRLLFENEYDAVMVFDAGTERFEDANRATLDLFGYTKEEFLQLTVHDISAERKKTRDAVNKVKQQHAEGHRVPLRHFQRKDGSTFPGEIFASTFDSHGKKKLIGAVRDISEHLRDKEKIHALTRELIIAQEDERHRIALYLHDQVAQDLSIIKIGCDTLLDSIDSASPEVKEKVAGYSKLLSKSISAVRDLTYELHPAGMDQMGLVRTTFQYCADFSSRSGIKVDFFSAGMEDLDLDFDIEINIFRIIQEGLNNIRHHADASRTAVRLVASAPNIILRIEDDGKGFEVNKRLSDSLTEKRMGLSSMEERAGLLGGNISIQSTPGEGTKIKVEIPIRE